jgi:hypothetical protein
MANGRSYDTARNERDGQKDVDWFGVSFRYWKDSRPITSTQRSPFFGSWLLIHSNRRLSVPLSMTMGPIKQISNQGYKMKNSKVLKTFIFLSGLLLTVFGAATLFVPITVSASHGVELGSNISLLNDVRGSGGVLLGSGIIILLGVFINKFTFTSAVVSIVVFLSWGTSRILVIAMDGMPHEGLVRATLVETIIGLVGVFVFYKYRVVR